VKRIIYALAFLAGAFAMPLSGQTPDSVKQGTPTREFYTKIAKPDTVTVTDTVRVASKPDTVWMPSVYPKGVDTVKYGIDSLRLTFWSTGRINDSTSLVVLPPPPTLGKPFGPSSLFEATSVYPFTYSGGENSASPQWLLDNIALARSKGVSFIANLPCGSHVNCLTDVNGVPTFDRLKWEARLARYNTPEIRAAVDMAYDDGVLQAINVMDEPWVYGGDDGSGNIVSNTWGPKGTMTKVRVDSLCASAKKVFDRVPVGTSDHNTVFDPSHDFKVCDIGISQFSYRYGAPVAWRDTAMAMAKRGSYQRVFSFNVLNGGTQDKDGVWDCSKQGGVKGTRAPNCAMTAVQVIETVTALGDVGCAGLMMWQYDAIKFALWSKVINEAAGIQAARPRRPCTAR
jgi:hypothetical protein